MSTSFCVSTSRHAHVLPPLLLRTDIKVCPTPLPSFPRSNRTSPGHVPRTLAHAFASTPEICKRPCPLHAYCFICCTGDKPPPFSVCVKKLRRPIRHFSVHADSFRCSQVTKAPKPVDWSRLNMLPRSGSKEMRAIAAGGGGGNFNRDIPLQQSMGDGGGCPRCGTPVAPGERFCSNCGNAV